MFQHPEFVLDLAAASPDLLTLGEDFSRYPLVIQIEVPNPPTTVPGTAVSDPSTSAAASSAATGAATNGPPPRSNRSQSQTTIAAFDASADNNFSVKALKQKVVVDGIAYIMQEVYGIEQKTAAEAADSSEEGALNGNVECVVCMADSRDTVVLPCRHLCLCNPCAEVLRYQSNKCPICRART